MLLDDLDIVHMDSGQKDRLKRLLATVADVGSDAASQIDGLSRSLMTSLDAGLAEFVAHQVINCVVVQSHKTLAYSTLVALLVAQNLPSTQMLLQHVIDASVRRFLHALSSGSMIDAKLLVCVLLGFRSHSSCLSCDFSSVSATVTFCRTMIFLRY